MNKFHDIIPHKKAFVFDFDNTLYPEKDYLYQVYYMIGQFLEYQEAIPHEQVTQFLIGEFESSGRENLFNKLFERFALKEQYIENCLRLMRTARLPLKLLLYKEMEGLLHHLVAQEKSIFLLTNGNVQQQHNKIMQTEWNGLDQYLRCYFANEIKPKPAPDGLLRIMQEHQLSAAEMVFIGDSEVDRACANAAGVDFYNPLEQ